MLKHCVALQAAPQSRLEGGDVASDDNSMCCGTLTGRRSPCAPVPLGVIAEQLGHADTRMTEKHYAHLAPSYVADTIRAHFPTLGIAGEGTVSAMRRKSLSKGRASPA
jgi:hypothetical protein